MQKFLSRRELPVGFGIISQHHSPRIRFGLGNSRGEVRQMDQTDGAFFATLNRDRERAVGFLRLLWQPEGGAALRP